MLTELAIVSTMKKIINAVWTRGSLDSLQLARYLRCLFAASLADSPRIAVEVLDQTLQLANEAVNVSPVDLLLV